MDRLPFTARIGFLPNSVLAEICFLGVFSFFLVLFNFFRTSFTLSFYKRQNTKIYFVCEIVEYKTLACLQKYFGSLFGKPLKMVLKSLKAVFEQLLERYFMV